MGRAGIAEELLRFFTVLELRFVPVHPALPHHRSCDTICTQEICNSDFGFATAFHLVRNCATIQSKLRRLTLPPPAERVASTPDGPRFLSPRGGSHVCPSTHPSGSTA